VREREREREGEREREREREGERERENSLFVQQDAREDVCATGACTFADVVRE
jgi:hypothetical protein